MKRTYFERCYIAFYWTLEHIFRRSKEPIAPHPFSLCDLLSNMCPFTFETGMSADPAAYFEYEQILKALAERQGEDSAWNGYRAGCEFLQKYMNEYGYELEEPIRVFSPEEYSFAYDKTSIDVTESQ